MKTLKLNMTKMTKYLYLIFYYLLFGFLLILFLSLIYYFFFFNDITAEQKIDFIPHIIFMRKYYNLTSYGFYTRKFIYQRWLDYDRYLAFYYFGDFNLDGSPYIPKKQKNWLYDLFDITKKWNNLPEENKKGYKLLGWCFIVYTLKVIIFGWEF